LHSGKLARLRCFCERSVWTDNELPALPES
jgi:hypothetical protein